MRAAAALSVMALLLMQATFTQQQPQFGGDTYASLDPRKQRLVDNWATRFTARASSPQVNALAGRALDDVGRSPGLLTPRFA